MAGLVCVQWHVSESTNKQRNGLTDKQSSRKRRAALTGKQFFSFRFPVPTQYKIKTATQEEPEWLNANEIWLSEW